MSPDSDVLGKDDGQSLSSARRERKRLPEGADPIAMGEEASDLYGRAVAADRNFALAYARWSYLESYLHWYNVDPGARIIETAHKHAEQAQALQPDLPEAHLALGYSHYMGAVIMMQPCGSSRSPRRTCLTIPGSLARSLMSIVAKEIPRVLLRRWNAL